jgi:hypothetical protein
VVSSSISSSIMALSSGNERISSSMASETTFVITVAAVVQWQRQQE